MDFVTLLRMDVKNRLNDLVGEERRILLLGVETNVFDIASRFHKVRYRCVEAGDV